jgi:hypothetical protein
MRSLPPVADWPEVEAGSALVRAREALPSTSPWARSRAGGEWAVMRMCIGAVCARHVGRSSDARAASRHRSRLAPVGRSLLLLWVVLGSAGVAVGCEERSVSLVEVAQVQVLPDAPLLVVGDSLGFAVVLRAPDGGVLPFRDVRWTSQDPSIATVRSNGLVSALGEGVTSIRASVGSVEGSALLTVEAEPTLEFKVETLSFVSRAGGTSVLRRELEVTSGGTRQLTGLAVEVVHEPGGASGWIEATLSRTTTPSILAVSVSPSGLGPGPYQGEVVLVHGERADLPHSLRVELLVQEDPPFLLVSPSALVFQADEGASPPPPVSVRITEASGRQVSGLSVSVQTASETSGWLTAVLEDESAPTELIVTVDPEGLSAGGYEGIVFVLGTEAQNSPLGVPVRFHVGEPASRIALSPLAARVTAPERGVHGSISPLQVRNEGGRRLTDLSVEVVGSEGSSVEWLVASLESTEAPTQVRLVVDQGNLAPGTYEAQVTVRAPDAANSPQAASVRLTLVPVASPERSTLTVDPEILPADGVSAALVEIQLNDPRGDPVLQGDDRVTVRLEGGGSLGSVEDQGRGRYTAILTSPTEPGTTRVTARVNGATLSRSALVEFAALPPPPQLFVTQVILTTPSSVAPHPHLRMEIQVEGEEGEGVEGARLSAQLNNLTTGQRWEYSGRTDRNGRVLFRLNRHPEGCYQMEVTGLLFEDHEWDGETPGHEYCRVVTSG